MIRASTSPRHRISGCRLETSTRSALNQALATCAHPRGNLRRRLATQAQAGSPEPPPARPRAAASTAPARLPCTPTPRAPSSAAAAHRVHDVHGPMCPRRSARAHVRGTGPPLSARVPTPATTDLAFNALCRKAPLERGNHQARARSKGIRRTLVNHTRASSRRSRVAAASHGQRSAVSPGCQSHPRSAPAALLTVTRRTLPGARGGRRAGRAAAQSFQWVIFSRSAPSDRVTQYSPAPVVKPR
jgi:hypothetical protein